MVRKFKLCNGHIVYADWQQDEIYIKYTFKSTGAATLLFFLSAEFSNLKFSEIV